MMRRGVGVLACVVTLAATWSWAAEQTPALVPAPVPAARPVKVSEKWVFVWNKASGNAPIEKAVELIQRIAKAGYTTIFLVDGPPTKPDIASNTVMQERIRRVIKECHDLKLKVVMPASGDILSYDPNLAEGMPVVGAPFVVRDG